jgi:hypothetical protein
MGDLFAPVQTLKQKLPKLSGLEAGSGEKKPVPKKGTTKPKKATAKTPRK